MPLDDSILPPVGMLITGVSRSKLSCFHGWIGSATGDSAARTFHFEARRIDGGIHWYHSTDEGVLWIRGHHAPDSPEVQALLATYLLNRGARAAAPW